MSNAGKRCLSHGLENPVLHSKETCEEPTRWLAHTRGRMEKSQLKRLGQVTRLNSKI